MPSVETPAVHIDDVVPKAALTPPTSEDNDKRDERLSSELSDIDSDDGEEIEPDHYFEGGKIPVFKPVRAEIYTVPVPSGELVHKQACGICAQREVLVLITICADYGPVPQLQALHRQDRQARNEVRNREGYSANRMVKHVLKIHWLDQYSLSV